MNGNKSFLYSLLIRHIQTRILHDLFWVSYGPLAIDQQYADDITRATTNIGKCTDIKKTIPEKLKERNLFVYSEKTPEEYI